MKRSVAAAALGIFCAGAVQAHDKVVVLPAKNGDVSFDHRKHKDVKGNCMACHETDKGGKIAGIGKDWAHKTCKGCHDEMKKGPTSCNGCHVKK